MSLMRTYRRALGLSQSAFAARLNVPLETYRPWDAGRREPWPTMLRPSFPRVSHPRLAQAIPSIACIAQVYLGGTRGFRPRSRR